MSANHFRIGLAAAALALLPLAASAGGRRLPAAADSARAPATPVIAYSTFLGGGLFDIAWSIAVDATGHSYIAGHTASADFPTVGGYQASTAGQGDAFVAKFNPDGTPAYITYLGGDYLDYAMAIAVDGAGNAYVTGATGSADFPIVNALQPSYAGAWDGFVAKLDPTGSALVYSTFLGGSGTENLEAIAVDAAGSAYVTGNTGSTDFPTLMPFQQTLQGSQDAFLSKLSADGSALVYSTYLGGSFGGETGLGVAVDRSASAIVTGYTTSGNFPTANAWQSQCAVSFAGCWDVFVTKFDPAGTALVYSTYLGGNDQEYVDEAFGIAVDTAGTAYVTGMTGSPNFPMLNPYQGVYGGQVDAFVARFASGGSLLSSTFLGGNNSDVGYGIAVDAAWPFRPASAPPIGVHVSGLTISNDFPVINPIQATMGGFEDSFVAQFTPNVGGLVYSTYLGGTNGREEYGSTIGVDARGNVYVTGGSEATDYPTVSPYQPAPHGSYDVVLTRIGPGPSAEPDDAAGLDR